MKPVTALKNSVSVGILAAALLLATGVQAQIRPPLGNPGQIGSGGGLGAPTPSGGGGLLAPRPTAPQPVIPSAPTPLLSAPDPFASQTEQVINSQAGGQYPDMQRTSSLPIGSIQNKWNRPIASTGQTAPGIMRFAWRPDFVMPIRTREFMTTTIELPVWENIDRIVLGDTLVFEATRVKPNILVIRPSHAGADTNMTVIGISGHIYNFYVRSESWNSNQITDFTVYVSANDPRGKITGSLDSGMSGTNSVPAATGGDGSQIPEYLRKIAYDPANLRFDMTIYAPSVADIEIAPLRAFSDGVWTYFDYGDKADTVRRPVIFRVVDSVDTMINTRTVGPKGNIMIAEGVGNFTLRNGNRVVCVYQATAPRSFDGSRSLPPPVPSNDASLFFNTSHANGEVDAGLPTQVSAQTTPFETAPKSAFEVSSESRTFSGWNNSY